MNAKPCSRSAAPADAASWSIRMPSASSTSADPAREVIARLPCLATGTPAAATTSAAVVEMLNVPLPSPPVPTTSIAPSGASTANDALAHRRREAGQLVDGLAAHPETHEQRGELGRRRLAVHHRAHRGAGLVQRERAAVDDRRQRRAHEVAHRAASAGSAAPARQTRPARSRTSPSDVVQAGRLALAGEAQEVGEQVRALRRQHGLRVELHALERQAHVADAHDDPVALAHRGDPQLGRQRRRVDRERVIAGGHERGGHARRADRRRRG